MRYLWLLFLLPTGLWAQLSDAQKNSGTGWYLSFRVKGEQQRDVRVIPYVTATDTLPTAPLQMNNLRDFRFRRTDTVRFAGEETVYYLEPQLSRAARRQDAVLKLLTAIKLSYQYRSGMELTAGLFYEGHTDSGRAANTDGFPTNFYYDYRTTRSTTFGLVTDVAYHFRRSRRLRPFLALQFQWGLNRRKLTDAVRVFPGEEREEFRLPFINDNFRDRTIFDLDLDITAGFNYRITDRIYLGLEVPLRGHLLPDWPNALQFRYRLSRPTVAP